jgi:hypothetical protein
VGSQSDRILADHRTIGTIIVNAAGALPTLDNDGEAHEVLSGAGRFRHRRTVAEAEKNKTRQTKLRRVSPETRKNNKMNAKRIIALSGAVLLALTSTCLAAGWRHHYNGNGNPGLGPPGAGYGQSQYVYTPLNVGPYNPQGTTWYGINNSGELVGNTDWPGPAPAGTTPPEIVVATILDKGNLTTWAATLPDGSKSPWSEFIGVNDKGVIVGDYYDEDLSVLGTIAYDFVRSPDGHITLLPPVPVPGGAPSYFVDENISINNEGTIVGTFTLDPNWQNDQAPAYASQGFILKDGKYTTWSYPGASATWFNAINDKGTIGGEWMDAAGNAYGFLLNKDGSTTSIVPPASLSPAGPPNFSAVSWVEALNNDDEAVGPYLYYDGATGATTWGGFLLSHGIYTQIYLPNEVGDTEPCSINDEGVIAGGYGGWQYGFVATPVH